MDVVFFNESLKPFQIKLIYCVTTLGINLG